MMPEMCDDHDVEKLLELLEGSCLHMPSCGRMTAAAMSKLGAACERCDVWAELEILQSSIASQLMEARPSHQCVQPCKRLSQSCWVLPNSSQI